MTSLYSGERVSKSSSRIEVVGSIDELNSLLGLCRAHLNDSSAHAWLIMFQKKLFILASEVADTGDHACVLDQSAIDDIESACRALEADIDMPDDFVIPGETVSSAFIDYARAVARRVERLLVALAQSDGFENAAALIWINRLSDFLWLLARWDAGTFTKRKDVT